MCSSRPVSDEPGVYEITTPGAMVEVGQRFVVVGGLTHERMIERELRRASLSFATWAARLSLPGTAGSSVVPDPARLAEARQLGLVHPSLASEPPDTLAA